MTTSDFVSIWDHQYFFLDGEITLTVHEDLDAGLGGTLFDGSVALSSFIETLIKENGRDHFVGKNCIELGAGCGFPGLFVGKLGAKKVVLTDIPGAAVDLLNENIELNHLEENCSGQSLDWLDEKEISNALRDIDSFDYILAADTVYSIHAVEPFIQVCKALSGENTQILFAHPRARVQEASNHFWISVTNFFDVEKVHPNRFVQEFKPDSKQFANEYEGVFILRLKRKS